MSVSAQSLCDEMALEGFCFVPSGEIAPLLPGIGADWNDFADSWNDMPLDTYMADGGRYRRRRYATLSVARGETTAILEPHQPHFQSVDYNTLNGGVARHYEAIGAEIMGGHVMAALLKLCSDVFNRFAPNSSWHVEVHQFRIEAHPGEHGQPTPEGVHRDGVDCVMVMMVKRHNIAEGTTTIHRPDGMQLASFTLTQPRDLTLVDDHRCLHGVTPVVPLDAAQRAYRDVLVVTFRRKPAA
ncbi:MAG: 2OG-Fe dioxygenase family protein [Betaproteobacteria bacterium]